MKVAITGASGFLGWHLRARLAALTAHEVVSVDRRLLVEPELLDQVVAPCDAVVHLAGINRGSLEELETGNQELARNLAASLDRVGRRPTLIYANSVQSGMPSPYGRGKAGAADILANWADRNSAKFANLRFPNIFGEGGRPNYNSFVATFCHLLAHDGTPNIVVDREVPLLHAQRAAGYITALLSTDQISDLEMPSARSVLVSEVLERLYRMKSTYAKGEIPNLADPFELELFNTYRSYLFPEWYPRRLNIAGDARGEFVEVIRTWGGEGQTSFSTTRPGVSRGNHYHLRKVERFAVVMGQADIVIRPWGRSETARYCVSGEDPMYVDMPTLCTHAIVNTGDQDLVTLFWISEPYDPADPDTFVEPVYTR